MSTVETMQADLVDRFRQYLVDVGLDPDIHKHGPEVTMGAQTNVNGRVLTVVVQVITDQPGQIKDGAAPNPIATPGQLLAIARPTLAKPITVAVEEDQTE